MLIYFFDYRDNCWWCGDTAQSGEHKYKKSDLIREFGKGPYKKSEKLLRVTKERDQIISGPKAKALKFQKNLCGKCNNSRSRPFDLAYTNLMDFVKINESTIISNRLLNLSEIYGSDWVEQVKNFKRYFIKHICCRLAEIKKEIPLEFINYLNGQPSLNYFFMKLHVMADVVAHLSELKKKGDFRGDIEISDLRGVFGNSMGSLKNLMGYYRYSWLRFDYLYDPFAIGINDEFSQNPIQLIYKTDVDSYALLRHRT